MYSYKYGIFPNFVIGIVENAYDRIRVINICSVYINISIIRMSHYK